MATGTITNTITDPSGNPIASVLVTFTLKPGPGFRISDGTEIAEITTATSNGSGAYTVALEQNANITPTNSYYEVNEAVPASLGGPNIWTIQVQSGTHTVLQSLATLLPPGSAIMSGSNTPITLVTGESASAGTSPQFIRADASLGVPVGTPLTNAVEIGNSVDAGSSGEFADSAHVHAVASGLPSSLIVGGSNVAGTNAAFPHLDHKHGLPAFGVPVSTSTTNTIGSSGLFAQSDHTHQTVGGTGGPTGSGSAITLSAGAAGASGSANTFIRGDATIGVPVAIPTTLEASVFIDSAGSSTSLSRADHQHATPTDFPTSLTPGGSNLAGTSLYFNSADHQHAIPAFGTPVDTGTANADGTSGLFAQSDHVHKTVGATGSGGSNVAITLGAGNTASAGVSNTFIRGDAVFGVPTNTPNQLTAGNASNTQGSLTQFARADHVHATPSAAAVSNALTNTAGSSGNYADAAHTHIGVGGVAPTLSVGDTSAVGSSPLALRSDLTIGVPTGAPTSLTVGGSNVAGTSTSFPRLDHRHALPAFDVPVSIGGSNQIGSSGLFAQSDHVHDGTAPPATKSAFAFVWNATGTGLVNGQTLSLTPVSGQATFLYPFNTEVILVSFAVSGAATITGATWSVRPNWDGIAISDIVGVPSLTTATDLYFSGISFHKLKVNNTSASITPTFAVNLLSGSGSNTFTVTSSLQIQMICLIGA